MKKIICLVLAVCLTACLFAGCGKNDDKTASDASEAQKTAEVIKFGTNAEFPPFEFVAANGVIDEFDGIDICIAKEIAEQNGATAKIENMEFDSLLVALRTSRSTPLLPE